MDNSKITLIANSGIQTSKFSFSISLQERYRLWFHEWFDTDRAEWRLDPVYQLSTEDGVYYYNKKELSIAGYLASSVTELDPSELRSDGITPLRIDDENCEGVRGEIFDITFGNKRNKLDKFENVWLPVPYFSKKTEKMFNFGPFNWARVKLTPRKKSDKECVYDAVLVFDTRVKTQRDEYDECPYFTDKFQQGLDFALCKNEFHLMDYCSSGKSWSYIDEYLLSLVHPEVQSVSKLKGLKEPKMLHTATFAFLMMFLAEKQIFPTVTLYRDEDVERNDVDMIVDIGNSKTTALLFEENDFTQVRRLELIDYSKLTIEGNNDELTSSDDSFDMRLVFRKIDFGNFGNKDSMQFVYPSLVRLGSEASHLLHSAIEDDSTAQDLSTCSSPKRYLWDAKPSKREWRFLTLKGEHHTPIKLKGITNQLNSDGTLNSEGNGGVSFHYSRRSLMTFAFLEMFVQARTQINSEAYRSEKEGFGGVRTPRRLRRVLVTCPTAMSKIEREALVRCARDAVKLLENFNLGDPSLNAKPGSSIDVLPLVARKDGESTWYYDEATCSQLVYMYGEAGYKYKGCCSEFFKLYGRTEQGESQPSITVGSLDIGGGTSDLIINKYTYEKGDITSVRPEPLFCDSFYHAGDDVLYALIKNVMLLDKDGAFGKALPNLSEAEFRQKMKNFFGPDHNGQTAYERRLRHDFNIQYSVPLMSHFLKLLGEGVEAREVSYDEAFASSYPSKSIVDDFKKIVGVDVTKIVWTFDAKKVSKVIEDDLDETLIKKVATIMYSFGCDIILLSGRPSSLPPIRNLFLKYYPVSANRLILLNKYYVGDWYPYCENTGYINDPKTVVAVGGAVAYYASGLSNLGNFILNLDGLNRGLKSAVNYLEASRQDQPVEYFITPEKASGEITISTLPAAIKVRQVGMDTYPCRPLYCVDFNRIKIGDKIRKRLKQNDEDVPDSKVFNLVEDETDNLKKRMPFTIQIEREPDDWETISIAGIVDKDGNDVVDSNIEISTQSIGGDGLYWLDSGVFDF